MAAGGDDDGDSWAKLIEQLLGELHPDQLAFALDPARYIVALVGRGGGKTTGGDVRFIRRMLTTRDALCLFVARTREHAKGLLWRDTKKMFKRLGFEAGTDIVYNETALTATLTRNGASLRLVGADKLADLDALRGTTFHEVGIDEGASHPDKILAYLIKEVVGPRLVGALWLIGTAGRRLKGLFYEVSRRGAVLSRLWKDRDAHPGWKGWSLHKWTLAGAIEATKDNPIPKLIELYAAQLLEIEAQGYSDDNPAKRREYDAEWAADDTLNVYAYRIHNDKGELWNQWSPERTGAMAIAKLPGAWADWVHIVAMDPGFSDPTALNVFAMSPSDPSRTIYHRLCLEQTKMRPQLIAFALIGPELNHAEPGGIIGAIGEWPNDMVADPAHQMAQAILDELVSVYGINIEPAEKGFRYKVGAIEVVNGDFFDGRIKVLKDSELEEQLIDLQWDESKTGEQIERKGQPNHSADCLVYARARFQSFISAIPPPAPPAAAMDPRAPGYVPPLPTDMPPNDTSHLMGDDDYAALFG